MTQYVLKTTIEEADAIAKGYKSFIFRGDQYKYGYGDNILFQVYSGQKMKRHDIDRMKFMVTYVSDEAPIEPGYRVIGLTRCPK